METIYLIEKIWMDSMENDPNSAVGYSPCGFVETKEIAMSICDNSKTYTRKNCWAILIPRKEYQYREINKFVL